MLKLFKSALFTVMLMVTVGLSAWPYNDSIGDITFGGPALGDSWTSPLGSGIVNCNNSCWLDDLGSLTETIGGVTTITYYWNVCADADNSNSCDDEGAGVFVDMFVFQVNAGSTVFVEAGTNVVGEGVADDFRNL